jgi:hypothetical protein
VSSPAADTHHRSITHRRTPAQHTPAGSRAGSRSASRAQTPH